MTALLARWPEPSRAGAAIVTNSGAFRGVALDFCAEIGLDLPALARRHAGAAARRCCRPMPRSTIRSTSPPSASRSTTSSAAPPQALLDDPGVGALVAAFIPGAPQLADGARALAAAGDRAHRPSRSRSRSSATRRRWRRNSPPWCAQRGVPLFRSPDRALRAMARLHDYGRLLARQRRGAARRAMRRRCRAAAPSPEYRAKAFLAALGIAVPAGRARAQTSTAAQAIAATDRLSRRAQGAVGATLPHKSDAGGVIARHRRRGGARARRGSRSTPTSPARGPDLALDGVLVETQAPPGHRDDRRRAARSRMGAGAACSGSAASGPRR